MKKLRWSRWIDLTAGAIIALLVAFPDILGFVHPYLYLAIFGKGRIVLHLPLRDWLEAATAPPLVERVAVTPAIAAEAAALPDSFHRNPADRIIVATARVLGATLLTLDRRIAAAGLVPVVG